MSMEKRKRRKRRKAQRALFSKGNAAEMPTAQLTEEDLTDGKIDILTMLVKSGLVTSKSEARRAVQQGGVAVDGEKVSDIAASFGKEELSGEGIILKKGKKKLPPGCCRVRSGEKKNGSDQRRKGSGGMGLNNTPMSERVHIGFFGRRNAGKSSVMNAVTGQDLAVVSDVKGTTTDPVYKSMESLPIGPVVMIDTPGIDDEGNLGNCG